MTDGPWAGSAAPFLPGEPAFLLTCSRFLVKMVGLCGESLRHSGASCRFWSFPFMQLEAPRGVFQPRILEGYPSGQRGQTASVICWLTPSEWTNGIPARGFSTTNFGGIPKRPTGADSKCHLLAYAFGVDNWNPGERSFNHEFWRDTQAANGGRQQVSSAGLRLRSGQLESRREVFQPRILEGYPSGQRGQTVNLLAYAFGGSNPPPSTRSYQ